MNIIKRLLKLFERKIKFHIILDGDNILAYFPSRKEAEDYAYKKVADNHFMHFAMWGKNKYKENFKSKKVPDMLRDYVNTIWGFELKSMRIIKKKLTRKQLALIMRISIGYKPVGCYGESLDEMLQFLSDKVDQHTNKERG